MLIALIAALASLTAVAQERTASCETLTPDAANNVAKPLVLPDGKAVRIRIVNPVSSATAAAGDKVEFQVAFGVEVCGLTIIARDAKATGHVVAAEKKRRKGKAGSLTVAVDSVELLTGGVASLRSTEILKGEGISAGGFAGDAAHLALGTYGLALPFTPFFLLQKGQDITLYRGLALNAFVNGDVPLIESDVRRLQPPPLAPNAPATVYINRLPVPPTVGHPRIYCGTVDLGSLATGEYIKIRINPGQYLFQSSGTKHKVQLELKPGESHYIDLSLSTLFKGNLRQLSITDGEDRIAAFSRLRENGEIDLTTAKPEELHSTAQPTPPQQTEEAKRPQ
jgi:hypothetical protein